MLNVRDSNKFYIAMMIASVTIIATSIFEIYVNRISIDVILGMLNAIMNILLWTELKNDK